MTDGIPELPVLRLAAVDRAREAGGEEVPARLGRPIKYLPCTLICVNKAAISRLFLLFVIDAFSNFFSLVQSQKADYNVMLAVLHRTKHKPVK